MTTKTIVFIHGMYMTPLCWEDWMKRFQARGYVVHAPAWPGRDRPVDALRKAHPDAQLGKLTLSQVVNHLAAFIQAVDEKPILIGHSMGGLATQLLLQKDIAAAGIAIDTAPPSGVLTLAFSFLKANWGHITPFANQSQPVVMTFERFQYAFVNGMPLEEQRAAFDRYVVPEARGVPRESLTAKVDFKRQHAPLLFIAGGNDHIIPASLNKTNFEKYKAAPSVTDFKEFPGRNHFLLGQKGWEEIADFCMDWIAQKGI